MLLHFASTIRALMLLRNGKEEFVLCADSENGTLDSPDAFRGSKKPNQIRSGASFSVATKGGSMAKFLHSLI